MRTINSIIIHCTATKPLAHINVNDVRRWHRERGFSDIGYHYLILVDGTVEAGRPLSAIGAHCKGHNAHSVGVCYVGGLNDKGKPAHAHRHNAKLCAPCLYLSNTDSRMLPFTDTATLQPKPVPVLTQRRNMPTCLPNRLTPIRIL